MMERAIAKERSDEIVPVAILAMMLSVVVWVYWNTLSLLPRYWDSPKYSHGYLIPLFTLVLLWLRQGPEAASGARLFAGVAMIVVAAVQAILAHLSSLPAWLLNASDLVSVELGVIAAVVLIKQPIAFWSVSDFERWCGAGLVTFGLLIRLISTYYPNVTPDMYSLIPCLLGIVLLVGGWKTLKWAGPPLAFLIFMFPLPGILDERLLVPLQSRATWASTYLLQTLGISAYYQGNAIYIGEVHLEVVEACSGLRMLTIFMAISVAIIMVTSRPPWESVVIFLSSFPIAFVVNVIRITSTGILLLLVEKNLIPLSKDIAEKYSHDGAGLLMMPMALGLMYLELQLLLHLFVEESPTGPMTIGPGARQPERQPAPTYTSHR